MEIMKIVILDGYTLNPGDLSWEGLSELGELTVYDRTPPELVIERIGDSELIFTNKTKLPAEILEKLPNLKFIGVLATGYDVVDVKYANEKGIVVCNIPTYGTNGVAEMTFALILSLYRNVGVNSSAVKDGEWVNNPDFCFWKTNLSELYGKTMGFIGFGKIGQTAAKIANAFDMKVIAYDKYCNNIPDYAKVVTDINEIFKNADIVSLHCPLTDETREIVNKESLSLMKKTAVIINTARGPLINEKDLAEALNNSVISGAGVDVLSIEPVKEENPLLNAENCIITPHIAWAATESRQRLLNIAIDNLKAFLDGQPINRV